MNAFRFHQATHSPRLDVDHTAGPDVNRLANIVERVKAFIKADRGLKLGLERSVVDQVIVSEWLLDQKQIERVKLTEPLSIGQGVAGIRINLKRQQRVGLTHASDHVYVVPRGNLELHPGVPFPSELVNERKQAGAIGLYSKADSRFDLFSCTSQPAGHG